MQEEIITVRLVSGTTSASTSAAFPKGRVKGVSAHFVGAASTDRLRVRIENATGREIVKLQSLEALKQRSGGSYIESIKPIDYSGGDTIQVFVQSESAVSANTTIDFIFLLDNQNCE